MASPTLDNPWQTLIPGFTALQGITANLNLHSQSLQTAIAAGQTTLEKQTQGMREVRNLMANTRDQVQRLDNSTQQIANAINLIRQFASQTHLLALKASIEAARAGEEGRGFSVIAEEVRGLAAQSAEATAAIEALVVTIQSEARDLGSSIKQSTQQLTLESRNLDQAQEQWSTCATAQQALQSALQTLTQQQTQLLDDLR